MRISIGKNIKHKNDHFKLVITEFNSFPFFNISKYTDLKIVILQHCYIDMPFYCNNAKIINIFKPPHSKYKNS